MKNKKTNNNLDDVVKRKHICLFYESKEDLLELAVPYFATGLRNNEFCMWVVSDELGVDGAKDALEKKVENFSKYIKEGQFEILNYKDWYVKSGIFNPEEVLLEWGEKEEQALGRGFSGMRVSGDGSWIKGTDWPEWMDYEQAVDKEIDKHKLTALCTFPLKNVDLSEIFILSSRHRFAFSVKDKEWHILKNIKLNNLLSNIKYYLKRNKSM